MDHRADLRRIASSRLRRRPDRRKRLRSTQRPRATVPAEARFYVKPGQQLQVDWADMGVVTVGCPSLNPWPVWRRQLTTGIGQPPCDAILLVSIKPPTGSSQPQTRR